jgi:hypothetical protein
MDRIMRTLKRDWEKALFGTMVLALLVSLAVWFSGGTPPGDSRPGNKATTRKTYLGNGALAFLNPLEAPRIPDNPFSFQYKADVKRPWRASRPARTNDNTTRPTRPTTTSTGKPAPTPAATPKPPAPAKPAAPPPARILTYRGYLQSTSGQMVAFVTVLDPNTKKSRMERLAVGRDIDGIEIKDFSGDKLEVVAPDGKPLRIPKGGRRKIVLE